MFFSVFWTAYIPVTLIILSLVGERLKQFFRESRAHAWRSHRHHCCARGQSVLRKPRQDASRRSNFAQAPSGAAAYLSINAADHRTL